MPRDACEPRTTRAWRLKGVWVACSNASGKFHGSHSECRDSQSHRRRRPRHERLPQVPLGEGRLRERLPVARRRSPELWRVRYRLQLDGGVPGGRLRGLPHGPAGVRELLQGFSPPMRKTARAAATPAVWAPAPPRCACAPGGERLRRNSALCGHHDEHGALRELRDTVHPCQRGLRHRELRLPRGHAHLLRRGQHLHQPEHRPGELRELRGRLHGQEPGLRRREVRLPGGQAHLL